MSIISGSEEKIIKHVTEILSKGKIVALPTETVYGLAADITNIDAVEAIYKVKGRPLSNPLIVHIENEQDLAKYSRDIPNFVNKLINAFWPGPLTFILKKSSKTPEYVTGGQDTVAIRMPNHSLTLKIIKALDKPIVAPSANKFTGISPTRPEHVIEEFNGTIDVVDGGICESGIESTIIDATRKDSFKILRPGAITLEQIKLVLKGNCDIVDLTSNKNYEITFPGNYLKHYSPKKNLISFSNYDELVELINKFKNIFIIHYSDFPIPDENVSCKIGKDPYEFAKDLYHFLRLGDNSQSNIIVIEEPPHELNWDAIWDRLNKAKSNKL
ncbi:MAG: L-threonylcarbamoyladenylate synthase [Neisseriaceae bacterium]|jgi:L-threonylcarbamoyladenylate synthase